MKRLLSADCAGELLPSAVAGLMGIILLWGTYRRSSTLVEPHIDPPLDLSRRPSQDWVKRVIPKGLMLSFLYLLGFAFVAGACLGVYSAVTRGSCGFE